MPCALLVCRDENDVVGTDPGRVADFNPFVERMGRPLLGSPRLRATTTATATTV
jgi:hypothetical protein